MEGFGGLGVAVGDVDLACETLVARRHGPHAFGDVNALNPRPRNEAHALNHIQAARAWQIVDQQLGVLPREAQHVNLAGAGHRVREAGVHRRVGFKRLAQVATRRLAEFLAAELLDVDGVKQRHALGALLKDDVRGLQQHAWLQGNVQVILPAVQHIDCGVAHHAHPQGVGVATRLDLEKPKRVGRRAFRAALPHHRSPWKGVEGRLADVLSLGHGRGLNGPQGRRPCRARTLGPMPHPQSPTPKPKLR